LGKSEPLSVNVDSHGTLIGLVDHLPGSLVKEVFPFTPDGIIEYLELPRSIDTPLSSCGHFGREGEGFKREQVSDPPF